MVKLRTPKAPSRCIERNPTTQSIMLGGRYINISAIARDQNIDQSYLSRVLSGKRPPSIEHARKIATALGYATIDDLMAAIEDRRRNLLNNRHGYMPKQDAMAPQPILLRDDSEMESEPV